MNTSYLFTPALKLDSLIANNIKADIIVIDLEDSILTKYKNIARSKLVDLNYSYFSNQGISLGLRINSLNTIEGILDIEFLFNTFNHGVIPYDYIFIPKIKNVQELQIYKSLFKSFKCQLKIISIIECLDAIDNVDQIAKYSDGLIFGAADLVAEMYQPNKTYLSFARAKICNAAARNNIIAIDTNSFELEDMNKLQEECKHAKAEGFMGKAAIHPNQLPIISSVFLVTNQEINKYKLLIQEFENKNNNKGFIVKKNKILAPPFIAKAHKMLKIFQG